MVSDSLYVLGSTSDVSSAGDSTSVLSCTNTYTFLTSALGYMFNAMLFSLFRIWVHPENSASSNLSKPLIDPASRIHVADVT